jgi:uncharacterized lipoprotein NlpE involved in copper resistance
MKKLLVVFMAVCVLPGLNSCISGPSADNARNSLDWPGVYTGTIPAADVSGINVQITLFAGNTFEARYQYLDTQDNEFTCAGTFTWDQAGKVITLNTREIPPYYLVGENRLTQLDMEGKKITGALADNYVLRK